MGGETTLVKTVLSGLSLYFFSLFRAKLSGIESLEQVRKTFFFWEGIVKVKCVMDQVESSLEAVWILRG